MSKKKFTKKPLPWGEQEKTTPSKTIFSKFPLSEKFEKEKSVLEHDEDELLNDQYLLEQYPGMNLPEIAQMLIEQHDLTELISSVQDDYQVPEQNPWRCRALPKKGKK